jgi:hypothetical protein
MYLLPIRGVATRKRANVLLSIASGYLAESGWIESFEMRISWPVYISTLPIVPSCTTQLLECAYQTLDIETYKGACPTLRGILRIICAYGLFPVSRFDIAWRKWWKSVGFLLLKPLSNSVQDVKDSIPNGGPYKLKRPCLQQL